MKKYLFHSDALVVWCPTWSKNLGRTLGWILIRSWTARDWAKSDFYGHFRKELSIYLSYFFQKKSPKSRKESVLTGSNHQFRNYKSWIFRIENSRFVRLVLIGEKIGEKFYPKQGYKTGRHCEKNQLIFSFVVLQHKIAVLCSEYNTASLLLLEF